MRVVAVLGALLMLPAAASAQEQVLGSALTAAPNWRVGCEVQLGFFEEAPTAQGVYSTRLTNQDCSWFAPVSAPDNGRITSFSVRAGSGATKIRFVVARLLQSQRGPAGGACCYFVAEFPPASQPPLTLRPNVVNTFQADVPVERHGGERTGILVADYIGISAVPNTGELPLVDVDPGPNSTLSGATSASFYYPRLGAIASDASSSRSPMGIPGVEVLLQATFAPAGTPRLGTAGVNPRPLGALPVATSLAIAEVLAAPAP